MMNAGSSECEEATGTTDQTGAGRELQTKVLFSEVATESPAHVQQPVYTTAGLVVGNTWKDPSNGETEEEHSVLKMIRQYVM